MPEHDDASRPLEEKKESSVDVQLGGRHLTLAVAGLALFGLVLFLLGRWSERMGRSEAPVEVASGDISRSPAVTPDPGSAPKDLTFYETLGKKSTPGLQEAPKSQVSLPEPPADLPPSPAPASPKPVRTESPAPSSEPPAKEPSLSSNEATDKEPPAPPKDSGAKEPPGIAKEPAKDLRATVASKDAGIPQPPKVASAKQHYRVQVASTRDLASARQLVDKLRRKGYQAAIETATGSEGQNQYKVRIGNYAERESAEKVAEKIRQEERVGAWIVKVQG